MGRSCCRSKDLRHTLPSHGGRSRGNPPGRADEAIGLIDRLAGCFIDERNPVLIEHAVRTLIGQRVFGMALGYEDINDHENLRHDPVFGTLLGKLEPTRRAECAPLAGKSTLNRLELHESEGSSRYHKVRADAHSIVSAAVHFCG